jgi:hypothetical protein
MQALLARNHVKVQPGQIQDLIGAGRAWGLTLEGAFAFVEDKLLSWHTKPGGLWISLVSCTLASNVAPMGSPLPFAGVPRIQDPHRTPL